MAISFLAPTHACILDGASAANIKGYVWLGLTAASDTAACCAFYAGSTTGDPLLYNLSVASGTGIRSVPLVGPFNISPCSMSVYCQLTGTRACALVLTAC